MNPNPNNILSLLTWATRAAHGTILGTLTHARFVVGSIAHHTKSRCFPRKGNTPHIDLTGALIANELRSHMPRWVFGPPHLWEGHWCIRQILRNGRISWCGRGSPGSIPILFASLIQTPFQGHLRQRALLVVPLRGTRLAFAISKQVNGDSRLRGGHTNFCRA